MESLGFRCYGSSVRNFDETLILTQNSKTQLVSSFHMKKCNLCSNDAVFLVKETSEYYCEDCALENFSDIGALTRIDEEIELKKRKIAMKNKGFNVWPKKKSIAQKIIPRIINLTKFLETNERTGLILLATVYAKNSLNTFCTKTSQSPSRSPRNTSHYLP